jgi:hypothetical protein
MPTRKVVKTTPCADDDSAAMPDGQPIIESADFEEPAGLECQPCGPADAEGCQKFACINCSDEEVAAKMTPAVYDDDGEPKGFRCYPCNSGRVRVNRTLKAHPSIGDMTDKADRASMVEGAKNLYGGDLVAHMRSKITQTDASEVTVSMTGTGNFMDLEDLAAKYATKPNRLAALKANAKTFFCEVSKTLLYEDMVYSSNRTDSASRKRENETVMEDINPKRIKAVGKPKADKAKEPTEKKAAQPINKPLSPKQCGGLAKTITDVSNMVTRLQTAIEPLQKPENTWVQHVPKYVGDGANLAVAHANALCVDESAGIRRSMIL